MLPLPVELAQSFGTVGHAQQIIQMSLFVTGVVKSAQRLKTGFVFTATITSNHHQSLCLDPFNPI
jgi:hypothetical protein